jgi:Histone chaperone Rttp106-like
MEDAIDITSCSASDLAEWLCRRRFDESREAAISFLQSALASLNSGSSAADSLLQAQNGSVEQEPPIDLSLSWLENVIPLRMLLPARTRLNLTCMSQEGILLTAPPAKGSTVVTDKLLLQEGSVELCFVLPPAQETVNKSKVEPERILLKLREDPPLIWKKKPIRFVGWHIPTENVRWTSSSPHNNEAMVKPEVDQDHANGHGNGTAHAPQLHHEDVSLTWIRALQASLQLENKFIIHVSRLSPKPFASFQDHETSTTTGGRPYVSCYYNVNDGILYPLEQGLLFLDSKQALFLHRSSMASTQLGRGGTVGGGRYIDWQCTLNSDEPDEPDKHVEFTNIHRDEQVSIEMYLQTVLIPAMQRDVDKESGVGADSNMPIKVEAMNNGGEGDGDGEDTSEDESEGNNNSRRKRPRRQASRQARAINKQHLQQLPNGNGGGDDDGDDEGEEEDLDYVMTSVVQSDSDTDTGEDAVDEDGGDDAEHAIDVEDDDGGNGDNGMQDDESDDDAEVINVGSDDTENDETESEEE